MSARKILPIAELRVFVPFVVLLAWIIATICQATPAIQISNQKQVALSLVMYTGDYDDALPASNSLCLSGNEPSICPEYQVGGFIADSAQILGDAQGQKVAGLNSSLSYRYWTYLIAAYKKNYGDFLNPKADGAFTPKLSQAAPPCLTPGMCVGTGFGGQDSFASNNVWGLSRPDGKGIRSVTSIERVAQMISLTEARFYVAAPDLFNQSGTYTDAAAGAAKITCYSLKDPTRILRPKPVTPDQCRQLQEEELQSSFVPGDSEHLPYQSYWKNLGNSNYAYSKGEEGPLKKGNEEQAFAKVSAWTKLNCSFMDGHVKAVEVKQVVGSICNWIDTSEGHPGCH